MAGRKGILFVIEWLIVADGAGAFMSGCIGDYCFISSPPSANWLSWDSAQQWCRNNGTRMIEITNIDIQNAMSSFLISGTYYYGDRLFTNGKRDSGSWTWVNKYTANFLSIGGVYDASYAYGYLQLTTSGFTLIASRPTDTKQGYICENESQCTNSAGFLFNSRCYKAYSNEQLSWYNARARCLGRGGDLASFDFISSNQGLSILNGTWLTLSTMYWVGLRQEWWTWKESETDIKYSNWLSGLPVTYPNDPNDCLCLQASSRSWTVCRCSETRPFICMSGVPSSTTTTTTTTTTPTTTTTTTTTTTSSTTTTTTPTTTSKPNPATFSPAFSSVSSIKDVVPVTIMKSTSSSEGAQPTTTLYGSSVSTTQVAVEGNKQKETLDREIAIGIGVGVGGGAVVVLLIVLVAVIVIRKRANRSNPEKKEKPKKTKKLQTPDIIALQTRNNREESPYGTVIRLPDVDETSTSENAPTDTDPHTIYANLEFTKKNNLDDDYTEITADTGSSRPPSPSRLEEADVEVDDIEYSGDHLTIPTCATFL